MIDLDNPNSYADLDRAGALSRILGLPNQVRAAWSAAANISLPDDYREARQILICGMGGSAVGGDLVRSLLEPDLRIPLQVLRGYELPGFVGHDTLIILSSNSGGTEETLACAEAALAAGAKPVAITTGGRLLERARRADFPAVQFSYAGQPREALGYSMLLLLGVLTSLGYVPGPSGGVEGAVQALEQVASDVGPPVATGKNLAKHLASRLQGKIGVVYGGGLMADVARRWKSQLNENAKNWAFFDQLPELNHNSVVGYRCPAEMAERLVVIMLSSPLNHPRVRFRETLTADLLTKAGVTSERIEAPGDSPLAQVLATSYLGDFTSYYLALLNQVDPSQIDALNAVKARMAEEPG